jgi:hypothetical protein
MRCNSRAASLFLAGVIVAVFGGTRIGFGGTDGGQWGTEGSQGRVSCGQQLGAGSGADSGEQTHAGTRAGCDTGPGCDTGLGTTFGQGEGCIAKGPTGGSEYGTCGVGNGCGPTGVTCAICRGGGGLV